MIEDIKSVGIIGTGSYVPEKVLTNFDLEKMVDTSDAWIRERTGIQERHIAPEGINTSDMATIAAQRALKDANISPEEIDLVIVATLTPDMVIPSTACMVQNRIGAVNAGAYDLYAGCSGFVYGTITAASYIKAGMYKNILVIGAEILSRYVNWQDRNTCVLFGDAAAAAVIAPVPEGYGLLGFDLGADGEGGSSLNIPSSGTASIPTTETIARGETFIHMDGKEVYRFAVKAMGGTVINSLEKAKLDVSDLDFFIPHQANTRIIDSAAKRLNLSTDKVYVNLPKYGNTSAASIPLALDEALKENKIKRGAVIALSGFGAGLTWASVVLKWY